MPNTMTMYTRDLGIRALFTPNDVVKLSSLEVALTRAIAVNNADLSQIVEPTDERYERQPYGLGPSYWAPTGFGTLYSTQLVEWQMVLEDTWGLIAGWVLIDPVGSQVINTGSILRPFEASTGITPRLPPGSMIVGFTDDS